MQQPKPSGLAHLAARGNAVAMARVAVMYREIHRSDPFACRRIVTHMLAGLLDADDVQAIIAAHKRAPKATYETQAQRGAA